jgi:hypothetical protein
VRQADPDQLGRVARVERERGFELAGAGVGDVAAPDRAAGVGHQQVKAAERGRDLVDCLLQRGRVHDVGRHRGDGHTPAVQTLGRGGQACGVACDEPDRHAFGGQRLGNRKPDAPASSRDQRAAAVQAQIHVCSLSSDIGGCRMTHRRRC